MRYVDRNQFDDHQPVLSIYQGGLREAFGACHAPVPPKMEDILNRLEVWDREHRTQDKRKDTRKA